MKRAGPSKLKQYSIVVFVLRTVSPGRKMHQIVSFAKLFKIDSFLNEIGSLNESNWKFFLWANLNQCIFQLVTFVDKTQINTFKYFPKYEECSMFSWIKSIDISKSGKKCVRIIPLAKGSMMNTDHYPGIVCWPCRWAEQVEISDL